MHKIAVKIWKNSVAIYQIKSCPKPTEESIKIQCEIEIKYLQILFQNGGGERDPYQTTA